MWTSNVAHLRLWTLSAGQGNTRRRFSEVYIPRWSVARFCYCSFLSLTPPGPRYSSYSYRLLRSHATFLIGRLPTAFWATPKDLYSTPIMPRDARSGLLPMSHSSSRSGSGGSCRCQLSVSVTLFGKACGRASVLPVGLLLDGFRAL